MFISGGGRGWAGEEEEVEQGSRERGAGAREGTGIMTAGCVVRSRDRDSLPRVDLGLPMETELGSCYGAGFSVAGSGQLFG